jgi:hypothetical protein
MIKKSFTARLRFKGGCKKIVSLPTWNKVYLFTIL